MKELTPTDFRNLVAAVDRRQSGLFDRLGNGMKGTFDFELIDPSTGQVEQRTSQNQVIDQGENAILQFIAGITDNAVQTFDGDGAKTQFQLPEPYFPVVNVNDVSVGGTTQSAPPDYAVDYWGGTVTFDTAPGSGTDNVSVDVDYTTHPFQFLAVGTDGTAVTESDTSLKAEDTRIGLDSGYYTRDESAVSVTGQWTFGTGQANVSIAEVGLFSVPSSAPVNGDMLNRSVVSPTVDKSSSQELRVTWTLEMT
jgi:hypothetical protein